MGSKRREELRKHAEMLIATHSAPEISEAKPFICVHTGNGSFVGDVWQIYRHEPERDTVDGLNYINHTPNILYKSQKACQDAIDLLVGIAELSEEL